MLSANQNAWQAVLGWLKLIPEPVVPKLFAMLKSTHPTLLRSEFIVSVSARVGFSERSASTRPLILELHAWAVSVVDQRPTRC